MLRVVGQMKLAPCDGCDGCGLRCTAGVPMSRREYETIKAYVESATNQEEIGEVVAQEKTVDLGDAVEVRMCRFRDMKRGRCVIYPVRPLVCRLLGHVEWMPCPIGKVERIVPTDEALELMRVYAMIERHSFEEWEEIESRAANTQPIPPSKQHALG